MERQQRAGAQRRTVERPERQRLSSPAGEEAPLSSGANPTPAGVADETAIAFLEFLHRPQRYTEFAETEIGWLVLNSRTLPSTASNDA